MPGYNPPQSDLVALTNLRTLLDGFAVVPKEIYASQMQVLAGLAQKVKEPSVFKGGNWLDYTFKYQIQGNTSQAQVWTDLGVVFAFVIPLLDASRIRLSAFNFNENEFFIGSPNFICYALSPNDPTNQIPADQFAMENFQMTVAVYDDLSTGVNILSLGQLSAEIPCDGNRYIHLFGISYGNDLFEQLSSLSTEIGLTYALIK